MFWVVIIVICMICSAFFESLLGKIVACSTTMAIGFLLLRWITDVAFFITLAKACAIIIVVAFMLASLVALIG